MLPYVINLTCLQMAHVLLDSAASRVEACIMSKADSSIEAAAACIRCEGVA